jgi:hypothetical protein
MIENSSNVPLLSSNNMAQDSNALVLQGNEVSMSQPNPSAFGSYGNEVGMPQPNSSASVPYGNHGSMNTQYSPGFS